MIKLKTKIVGNDEEGLCNISAKSHNIIHNIVERFLKEEK